MLGTRPGVLERLAAQAPLLSDSATGTWFQQRLGDAVGGECCDHYNVTAPDLVRELYRAKAGAGAELILTNTFNGTPLRLREFGLEAEAEGINEAGVRLLREVLEEHDRPIYVGGDVGPTGKLIGQSATYDEVVEAMIPQIRVLVRAGVDVVCAETMLQSLEGQAAVEAAREAFTQEGRAVPLAVTFSFMNQLPDDAGEYRTFFGETVRDIMEGCLDRLADRRFAGAVALGIDIVGANCTIGIEEAVQVTAEFARYLREHDLGDRIHISAKPNAQVMATGTYEDPDFVAARFADLAQAGAHVVGFCCGSLPEHIRAVALQRRRLLGF